MEPPSVTPLHSPGILELNHLFNNLRRPYGKGEVVRFNLAYQRIYPKLSRVERQHAEVLVDAMIADLENDNLASQIYGVV